MSRISLVLAASLVAVPSFSAEWRLSKGIAASTEFTDNVDSTTSTVNTRADTVLGLTPFVGLAATGRRHVLVFDGQAELRRSVDLDRTTVDPNASIATRSVLIDRLAELETTARVSQRTADGNPLADADSTFDERREETWEFGLSPSLESTLGGRFRIRGEYSFAAVRSSDDELVGSETHAVSSRLDAVLDSRGTFGLVALDSADVRFEDGDSGHTTSARVGVGRPIGRKVRGTVTIGRDRTRVGELTETLEDPFWDVTLRWGPNPRALVILGYGERVFGRKPSASLRLNGRRSSVGLVWSRELSLARDTTRRSGASLPFADETTEVSLAEREEGALDEEPLSPFARDASRVRERVEIGFSLNGRRTRLTASAGWFHDEQLEGGSGDTLEVVDPTGVVSSVEPANDSSGHELTLGFVRTLSARADLSTRYRFLQSRADGADGSVRKNVIELVLKVRL